MLHITLTQALSDQDGPQGVIEALSSSGAVSTWFMAHVYEVLHAIPQGPGSGSYLGSAGSSLLASVGNGGPASSSHVSAGRRKGGLAVLERPLPLSGGDQVRVCLCACIFLSVKREAIGVCWLSL